MTKTKFKPETNKNINHFMSLPYKISVYQDDSDEGSYWVAHIDELKGCTAHGETIEQAYECVKESMRYWLETALENGITIPEPIQESTYSGRLSLRLPKALHRDLVHRAQREGISLNTWLLSVLSRYGS